MAKELFKHQDYFGRDITVDDYVVFSVHNLFQVGRVVRLGEKKIRIEGYDHVRKNWRTGVARGDLKYGKEVLKVDEQEVLLYLLKKPSQT